MLRSRFMQSMATKFVQLARAKVVAESVWLLSNPGASCSSCWRWSADSRAIDHCQAATRASRLEPEQRRRGSSSHC